MSQQDPFVVGLENGWKILDAATFPTDKTLEADVVVIGTGAGGGTTAEILARSGLSVVLVEEGRLYRQADFRMDEQSAYSRLYQEGMTRTTRDGAIAIIQGRCVGGSTTVNWTSSFRTPPQTLAFWRDRLGIEGMGEEEMAPWFAGREERHHMAPWHMPPNGNNDALRMGCERLGWSWGTISRNVRGCWNLGYCGFGCPTNAKLGALTTTVPGALNAGATLIHSLRAEQLHWQQDRINELEGVALDATATEPTGVRVRLRARHFVVAASAIGSPGLMLRSKIPDPHQRLGKGSFLHPVGLTLAEMPERVDAFHGAPQSIYSDEFNFNGDRDSSAPGFKLEVPPLHPAFLASGTPWHGQTQASLMARLPWLHCTLALLRDGFHPDSPGGEVSLREDGSPVLDYPFTDYLWRGLREAYLRMSEAQFAAGAKSVRLAHMDSPAYRSWREAREGIAGLPMTSHRARISTAHQMGGCAMGADPTSSVVDSNGRHHQLTNLSVHDASVFPTSIGANPQLTVYTLAARYSHHLAKTLDA